MPYSRNNNGSVMPSAGSYPSVSQSKISHANSQVIGYLGRALSLEFTAGQNYLAQASLAKFRQEMEYAEGFIQLANEEFQHANLITDRMVAHGVLPANSILQSAGVASNIVEALQSCEQREMMLVELYAQAAQYCATQSAHEDQQFFNQLLEEEQRQLSQVQAWLQESAQTQTKGSFV